MAYAEVATQLAQRQSATTIIIGNNGVSTVGDTTFTNPPPEVGVDYYVFIRLYSNLDVSQGEEGGGGLDCTVLDCIVGHLVKNLAILVHVK